MSQQQKTTQSQEQEWTATRARGLEGNRRPVEELQGDLPRLAQFLRLPGKNPDAVHWRFLDERIRKAIRSQDLTREERAVARMDLRRFRSQDSVQWRTVVLIGGAVLLLLAAAAGLFISGWLGAPRPAVGCLPAPNASDGFHGADPGSRFL
jgi:hypothetical protein